MRFRTGSSRGRWRGGRDDREDRSAASYGQLALRLEHDLARHDRGCSVLLASADDARFAVEATAELGWYLAEEVGRTVLLVDGSFGSGGLTSTLGERPGIGLMELLELPRIDPSMVESALHPTRHQSIRFLTRGYGDNGRLVPARTRSVRDLLEAAVQIADFVLVQGGAVLEGGRSLAFGGLVDAVLLVALEDATRVSTLERSHHVLSDCGAERVGLVLASPPGRRAGRP